MPKTYPLCASLIGAIAALALAATLAAPAAAQDAAQDATPDAATEDCTPGAFGEGAALTVEEGDDDAITEVSLEFQCGDVLSDGTFIPTGYRLQLTGMCGEAECNYPLVMATPTQRRNQYQAFFVDDEGRGVTVRLRKARRRTNLNTQIRAPRGGDQNDAESDGETQRVQRAVYRLQAQ